MLQDQLTPLVELLPAILDRLEVDLVVDVHELEQMEEKERHAAVRRGDQMGGWARPAHARIELAEVDVAGVGVDQEVHAEGAAIALLVEAVAELPGHALDGRALLLQAADEDVVAAPAALVGGQLAEAGDVGHDRAGERAVAGGDALDRAGQVIDALHHLQRSEERRVGKEWRARWSP